MKISSISQLASALLLFSTVEALPKAPWVRQHAKTRGKKLFTATMDKREDKKLVKDAECQIKNAQDVQAPKENIWGGLSGEEAASVVAWLFAQKDMNLTVSENAGNWDNTISTVELMMPNKTDAIAYMDGGGPVPPRYARAILDVRSTEDPYFQEILVGPLPIKNGTTKWRPLDYTWTRQSGGRVRNLDADNDLMFDHWLYVVGAAVADITLDLWNATMLGLDNDTLTSWGIDPPYEVGDRFMRWDQLWSKPQTIFDTTSLMQMGLFFLSDVTGRDPSKWSIEGWYYNGVFYETTKEFRDAYWAGKVEKLAGNVDKGDWAHTDKRGPVFPLDTKAPPVAVAPEGARFSVDSAKKYVEWMGWSFYLGFKYDTGMVLHDIKFKGQRILYELGMQEAIAHYAGSDPTQANTAYLDSLYGFGPFSFELLKGYDCPSYATYINSSFYVAETTHTHLNSICLFEYDADFPMARHSTKNYVAATKNIYFVIRSVSTIGNYDYMFSYTFFMDGLIAVEVRASGYIQAAFYAKNEDYGFKIHDQLSGSMHDHVINYKADFDILGTANSVQLINQVAHKTTYPWSKGMEYNTMKLERKILETEDESKLDWSYNNLQQIHIVNQDKPNKYGEFPAYRVMPYTGVGHLTMKDSSVLKQSAKWAENDVMITRAKDTEPRSCSIFNTMDKSNPPVDFTKFFDGESLNQEDLVVWFNLGMHHVPHTGDLPVTVFTTAHSGVQFMPINYFEHGTNVDTVNMVRLNYKAGNVTDVITFDSSDHTCELKYEPQHVDLWDYKGDVVVRKYPYDPRNSWYEGANGNPRGG